MGHSCWNGVVREIPPKLDLDPRIEIVDSALANLHNVQRISIWEQSYWCPTCRPDCTVEAARTAMDLMSRILTELQFSNYYHHGKFVLLDRMDQTVVIRYGAVSNLYRKRATGHRWGAYCCHPEEFECVEQANLEQYLALSTDEHCEDFWATANYAGGLDGVC